jgi:hypothetical protein
MPAGPRSAPAQSRHPAHVRARQVRARARGVRRRPRTSRRPPHHEFSLQPAARAAVRVSSPAATAAPWTAASCGYPSPSAATSSNPPPDVILNEPSIGRVTSPSPAIARLLGSRTSNTDGQPQPSCRARPDAVLIHRDRSARDSSIPEVLEGRASGIGGASGCRGETLGDTSGGRPDAGAVSLLDACGAAADQVRVSNESMGWGRCGRGSRPGRRGSGRVRTWWMMTGGASAT